MRLKPLALCLAVLASLAAAPTIAASPSAADYSDLWWNSGENGWGAHITLQDDMVFMVLYV